MYQYSKDPVQQTRFPLVDDAWVTHLLAGILISGIVGYNVINEQPWSPYFAFALFLTTLVFCLQLLTRGAKRAALIITLIMAATVVYLRVGTPIREIQIVVWLAYSLLPGAVAFEFLRGSPSVMEEYGWAMVIFGLAIVVGAVLVLHVQWHLWSSASVAAMLAAFGFALTTHKL